MTKKNLIILVTAVGIIILVIAVILVAGSCNRRGTLKADSPENLARLARNAIGANNYTDFQALFTTATRAKVDQQAFGSLVQSMTDEALYADYVLMRLENGQLLLLYMTGPDEQGQYQLRDVRAVPVEMAELFNH